MFLRSSILLILVGFAAAQSTTPSPSDECFNTVINEVEELSNNVLNDLAALKQGATNGTLEQILNAEKKIQGDVEAYITTLRQHRDEVSQSLRNCSLFDPFCHFSNLANIIDSIFTDLLQLPNIVNATLSNAISTLESIVALNGANLDNTINSIKELKDYIATNGAGIRSCLISKFPLLGPLLE